MPGGTFGVVGDTQPFMPQEERPKVNNDPRQEEMARLGSDGKKWPQITKYLRERQATYMHLLPGGNSPENSTLTSMSHAERGMWWLCAQTMIAEFQAFEDIINEITDAKRRQPPEVLPAERVE